MARVAVQNLFVCGDVMAVRMVFAPAPIHVRGHVSAVVGVDTEDEGVPNVGI